MSLVNLILVKIRVNQCCINIMNFVKKENGIYARKTKSASFLDCALYNFQLSCSLQFTIFPQNFTGTLFYSNAKLAFFYYEILFIICFVNMRCQSIVHQFAVCMSFDFLINIIFVYDACVFLVRPLFIFCSLSANFVLFNQLMSLYNNLFNNI